MSTGGSNEIYIVIIIMVIFFVVVGFAIFSGKSQISDGMDGETSLDKVIIIRSGNEEQMRANVLNSKIFECLECGCVFDAPKSKYHKRKGKTIFGDTVYCVYAKCPYCGNRRVMEQIDEAYKGVITE